MSFDVATTVVIEHPISEVASFTADPANLPSWWRPVASVEWVTEPPVMLGSQFLVRGRHLGRALVRRYEVVESTPGEQVAVSTTAGAFPTTTTLTWRPVGDHVTHVTLRTRGRPTGLDRLRAPFVARSVRRASRRALDDLRRHFGPR